MIIVIASAKGGSGKTTTAVHLAEYLSRKRSLKRVVLLDADPDNRSASKWYGRGDDWKFDLVEPGQDVEGEFNALVVDSGAAPESDALAELLEGSDLLIVPTGASILDLESAVEVANSFNNDGSVKMLVVRALPGRSKEGAIAVEELSELGFAVCPNVVRQRSVLKDCPGEGATVAHLKSAPAKKAWSEYQTAFKWLLEGLV